MTQKQNSKNVNSGGGKKKPRKKTEPQKVDTFKAFIDWSVMTSKERDEIKLSTAKLFAGKYKLHESQLSRWKDRNDFVELKSIARREKWEELTPDVIHGLYERCVRYGMASDVELWLAYVEGWDKKQVLEHREEITLGPNDIRAMVDLLPEEKQGKFYDVLTRLISEAEYARYHGVSS